MDQDLLPRLTAGDPAALGELFDRHAPAVRAFCARQSPGAADDLLSVVFLEAWDARGGMVLVEGSLRPWLLGVARRQAAHTRRSLRRHRAALARFHADDVPPDPADRSVARLDAPRLRTDLDTAIARLPAPQRAVVELCLVDGLTSTAAGVVLGIPGTTVRSRLARARTSLQRRLTEDAWNPTPQPERTP